MQTITKACLLAVLTAACALGAQLSLPIVTAAPGSTAVLPVTFSFGSGAVVTLQFDLQYDSSNLALSATIGESARASGKTLALGVVGPGQMRFLIAALNRNPIADGALVNLFVSVNGAARNAALPVKILNLVAADVSARAVTVTAVDGTINIQGTTAKPPRLLSKGVLNAASLLPGSVAPGEIVTLLGAALGPSLPQLPDGAPSSTVLDETSVLFDGTPAPLLYAGANQINAIAPYGIRGSSSTNVQVTQRGLVITELPIPVSDASPALFTVDSSGAGQAAILNEDSTPNSPSNPAGKGSIVVLYATGGGQTEPPGTDGQITGDVLPRPLQPVTVKIGGLDAKVLYAGAAPGLVAGVLQVNCIVPLETPSGHTVPIELSVGGAAGPAGATVAVR